MGLSRRGSWRRQPRTKKGRWKKAPKKRRRLLRRGSKPSDRYTSGMVTVTVKSGRVKAEDVAREYDLALRRSFTQRERDLLARSGGVRIVVDRVGGGILGGYEGRKYGKHSILVGPRSVSAETLTHETIHALQECDPERPALERRLRLSELESMEDGEELDELCTLKESLTEAETLSRRRYMDTDEPGYYHHLSKTVGRDAMAMKREDHGILRRDRKAIRRGDYVGNTYRRYPETNIKDLKLDESTKTAIEVKKALTRKHG